jgi:hypothetical protein
MTAAPRFTRRIGVGRSEDSIRETKGRRIKRLVIAALAAAAVCIVAGTAVAGNRTSVIYNSSEIGRSKVLKSDSEYVRVTLLAMRNPARSTNEFFQPGRGHKYVALKLRIANLDRKVYDDSPSNGANLVGTNHVSYDADMFDSAEPGIGSPRILLSCGYRLDHIRGAGTRGAVEVPVRPG